MDHWPLIGAIAAGLVAWGVTAADIQQLKADRDAAQNDHDAIIRIETKQDQLQRDMKDIKNTLKDLAERERNGGR